MTRQHAILWGSTLLISLSYGEASFAENKPLPPDADTAFAEADTDSNGRIDHVEFHQRMVEVFYFADRDRDGYLAGTEIEQTGRSNPAAGDANADGKVSMKEMIDDAFDRFDAGDLNDDEGLDIEEVRAAYAN